MKILVADDEDMVRKLVVRILERGEFEVIEVSDGTSAIEALSSRKEEIGILFLDNFMPGATGVEVLRAARQLGLNCPAILSSGIGDPLSAEELTSLAPVRILEKPYRPTTLMSMLEELTAQDVATQETTITA